MCGRRHRRGAAVLLWSPWLEDEAHHASVVAVARAAVPRRICLRAHEYGTGDAALLPRADLGDPDDPGPAPLFRFRRRDRGSRLPVAPARAASRNPEARARAARGRQSHLAAAHVGRSLHGLRALVAVRVRAVLRAGLARGAHRHQAAALGIAAAAALVFPGPQFFSERAAPQSYRSPYPG